MGVTAFFPAIAEIFLAGVSIVLVLVAAFGGEDGKASALMRKLAVASLIITGILVASYGNTPSLAFGHLFMTSPFMVYMKLLVLFRGDHHSLDVPWPCGSG